MGDSPKNVILRPGFLPPPPEKRKYVVSGWWEETRVECDNCKCVFKPRHDQIFIGGYSDVDYLAAMCPTEGCGRVASVKSNPSEEDLKLYSYKSKKVSIPNHEKLTAEIILEVYTGKARGQVSLTVSILGGLPPSSFEGWKMVSHSDYTITIPWNRINELASCNNVRSIRVNH